MGWLFGISEPSTVPHLGLRPFVSQGCLGGNFPSLKLTFLSLKMDGWNMMGFVLRWPSLASGVFTLLVFEGVFFLVLFWQSELDIL